MTSPSVYAGLSAEDVAVLRHELHHLGFEVGDADDPSGLATFQAVLAFQKANQMEASGILDERTASRIRLAFEALPPESRGFLVQGCVRQQDGTPFAAGIVRAFDKRLRDERQVGEDRIADRRGRYTVTYTPAQFRRAAKSADLIIRVYDPQTRQEVVSSPVRFGAKPLETIDLVVGGGAYRGPSEYERLLETLAPAVQETPLHELSDEDAAFLADSTGADRQKVTWLAESARLATRAGLPAETFYALARHGLPTEWETLLRQHPTVLRRALEAALAGNVIPPRLAAAFDEVPARLHEIAITDAVTGEDSLGGLLRTSPLLAGDAKRQQKFVRAYLDFEGTPDSFWDRLREDPDFADAAVIREVKTVLDLAALTRNHLPMVRLLQEELRRERAPKDVRALAAWSRAEWQAAVRRSGVPAGTAGADDEAKAENYAGTLFRAVEAGFPTAVAVSKLRGEQEQVPDAQFLLDAFDRDNEFELATADIDRDFGEPADARQKDALNSWKRVFRLSPTHGRYEAMKALKMSGLDSAQAIVRLGHSAFLEQYADKLGATPAREVWDNASQVNGLTLTLLANFGHDFNKLMPKAVPYMQISDIPADFEGKATLEELFGSLDFCQCEHCKSLYGPAAYLVDLLQFLKNGTKNLDGRSPLTVLLGRRPDLAEIELSCENTNTRMPYVDLVNEVLETTATRFRLDSSVPQLEDWAGPLHPDPTDLWRMFGAAGYPVSGQAKLSSLETRLRWLVTDGPDKYVILNEGADPAGQALYVYALTDNQTRSTENELSVQPEHTSQGAYRKLARAVYPWDLPFDLWWDEARIYMTHLGFNRYEWIEAFPPARVRAYDVRVACERLGLTTLEYELIIGAVNLPEPQLWGLGGRIEELCAVKTLLRQAGFDSKVPGENFKALRQLAHARFVDPDDILTIRLGDDCDLAKAALTPRGAQQPDWTAVFSRMRRFLRLQRKLGWTIPDLDTAIAAFQADDLDGTLIVRLSNLERLRAELGVARPEMLSWWGAIDTAEDRAEEQDTKKAPSLYEKVFLNRSVDNPANPLFALNASRTELQLADTAQPGRKPLISQNAAAVAGALQISIADLKRLVKGQDPGEDGPVADELNLANLSALYRIVSLSRALKLKVREFLSARAILGLDPFADIVDAHGQVTQDRTASSREFVQRVREIQASAFTVAELDYLLRHRYEEATDLFVPTDADIAQVLAEIASGLAKITAEAAGAADPEGELTAKRLALLLEPPVVAQVLQLLRSQASTVDLPAGVDEPALPAVLKDKVTYDKAARQLHVTWPLTPAEKAALLGLSPHPHYQAEIERLYDRPRTVLAQELAPKLQAVPWLADALQQALDQESGQEGRFGQVLAAVNEHLRRTLSENLVKERLAAALALDADVTALLLEKIIKAQGDPAKPVLADFLALAVPGLSEERRGQRSGMLRAERSGAYTFRVQPDAGTTLWVNDRPIEPIGRIDLEAGKFYSLRLAYATEQPPAVYWQPPSAPEQPVPAGRLVPATAIASYRLLHKSALLVGKLKTRADEVSYLAEHGGDFKQFDPNRFPRAPRQDAPLYEQWRHLTKLFAFRDAYSQARVRLIDVFAAAQRSAELAKERLLALTGWNKTDFSELAGPKGFALGDGDLKGGGKLDRLHEAFTVLQRLGISAQQLLDWVGADLGLAPMDPQHPAQLAKEAVVQSLKQAVKAKYDRAQWLTVARPLRDELREKQRAALVAFLVHDLGLDDASELYARLLVDVEMSPCMMTSRIVQAAGAVQLFVQRSLMGLEPGVSLSPAMATEWEWRKNYRVWEANRKVFLYPENWIEPELRDDKSPFFEELENELLQNELTDENVEKAFLTYLHKVDEVSRLEIVGMYEQKDGWFEAKEKKTQAYALHVFGRTQAIPHVYYYRRWIKGCGGPKLGRWTAWERVDLDIEGDHLIPVVWNGRLHLFWPIFTPEAEKPKDKFTQESTGSIAKEYWVIQFAWSEYKNGNWTAQKTTEPLTTRLRADWLYPREVFRFGSEVTADALVLSGGPGAHHPEDIEQHEMSVKFTFTTYHKEPAGVLLGKESFTSLPFHVGGMALQIFYMMLQGGGEFGGALYLTGAKPVLKNTPSQFRLLVPHSLQTWKAPLPLFYQDDSSTFLVRQVHQSSTPSGTQGRYKFATFFHPHTRTFMAYLNQYGVKGLLGPEADTAAYPARRQLAHDPPPADEFAHTYGIFDSAGYPTVLPPYPTKDVDFSQGAYSDYNWEIFFHIPLLIANRLSNDQRFAEAMRWFHYIFNPMETADGYPPERFWKFRPFYEMYLKDGGVPKRIQELLKLLRQGNPDMEAQVREWINNPFKPHAIARLRPAAYMNTVVMKYLDNLIAWGDQLFRQYTMESVNEATQLYILAAEILGRRPEEVPASKRPSVTYRELEDETTLVFSNVLIKIENKLLASGGGSDGSSQALSIIEPEPLAVDTGGSAVSCGQEETLALDTRFFCIPHNDKLLEYWDTVEDRLFKLRHCMTIEGRVRELPLFQPPIEPGLLVRAVAAGVDIASVIADLSAPLPHYRFRVIAQKAAELCAEVRSFGAALLAALEKKDGEELALMRSRHELQILTAVREVKKQQLEEAKRAYEGLLKAKELADTRQRHYADLIKNDLNANERAHLDSLMDANMMQMAGQALELAASSAHSVPDITTGTAGMFGSPVFLTKPGGGTSVGSALSAQARYLGMLASAISTSGTTASIEGGFERRAQEWALQEELAKKEGEQIAKQIAAAEIRVAIAEKELQNHQLQTANAKEADGYLRGKFTNTELYGWMVSQLSGLYFGSYQLGYDLAKRAEAAYRHELGLADSDFIKFGYWDSLKKGLLAGERLAFDLKRMETAYLEQNRREYEITKHVSLALLDPAALISLQQSGACYVSLPEALFDLDYPGHYLRRIRSASLTIPCVTGPYTGVNCTLTLLKSSVRHSPLPGNGYERDPENEDSRFTDSFGTIQSIVTSSGQNDAGLFETDLHDERYLPFEGAGAISTWQIELPRELRQFDYSTIADVVLHLRYTARDGGDALRRDATDALWETLATGRDLPLARVFSLKHEFPGEWSQLFQPLRDTEDAKAEIKLDLSQKRFPYAFQRTGFSIAVRKVIVLADLGSLMEKDKTLTLWVASPAADTSEKLILAPAPGKFGGLPFRDAGTGDLGIWTMEVYGKDIKDLSKSLKKERTIEGTTTYQLDPDTVKDVLLLFEYGVTKS